MASAGWAGWSCPFQEQGTKPPPGTTRCRPAKIKKTISCRPAAACRIRRSPLHTTFLPWIPSLMPWRKTGCRTRSPAMRWPGPIPGTETTFSHGSRPPPPPATAPSASTPTARSPTRSTTACPSCRNSASAIRSWNISSIPIPTLPEKKPLVRWTSRSSGRTTCLPSPPPQRPCQTPGPQASRAASAAYCPRPMILTRTTRCPSCPKTVRRGPTAPLRCIRTAHGPTTSTTTCPPCAPLLRETA